MKTPLFIVDEEKLQENLSILRSVKERTECKILLALKGFAMWSLFPMIREVLDGVCASSPWEARLGREEFGKEVHAYAAAYSDADFRELLLLCDEIDFNSFAQYKRFFRKELLSSYIERDPPKFGLRINPECSTQGHALYDPCAPKSRLGILQSQMNENSLEGISGLHFHTLCEQNVDALEITLDAVEEKFGEYLSQMDWVNFGGGHHITRADYNMDRLCELINAFKAKYDVQVILEPGEAVVLNAGVLVASILDIVDNNGLIVVLDISCTCHMPDVLEMPYRPTVTGAGIPDEKKHNYRLAGLSCLAGDVIGDYSFDHPLKVGDQLVFEDMAHYTMVKTTMFNGVQHPSIAIQRMNGKVEIIREFRYSDYKGRLS